MVQGINDPSVTICHAIGKASYLMMIMAIFAIPQGEGGSSYSEGGSSTKTPSFALTRNFSLREKKYFSAT